MNQRQQSERMTDVEVLTDIRNDAHDAGKDGYKTFKQEKSIPAGHLMCRAYNTAMRAMYTSKRYYAGDK